MNLKPLMAAAVVASAALFSTSAGAATCSPAPLDSNCNLGIIGDGESNNDLILGNAVNLQPFGAVVSWATGVAEDGVGATDGTDGRVAFDVFADPFLPLALGTVTVNFNESDPPRIRTVRFDGTEFKDTIDIGDGSFEYTISANLESAEDLARVVVRWTGAAPLTDFDVRIQAVPVPAGVLLMGTALAGFGVMRRKKKKAA